MPAGCVSGWKCGGQAGGRESPLLLIGERPGKKDMASWMGRDLSDVLSGRHGGYPTRILGSKDEFKQNVGQYLLDIRITRYNPGNKPPVRLSDSGPVGDPRYSL